MKHLNCVGHGFWFRSHSFAADVCRRCATTRKQWDDAVSAEFVRLIRRGAA